MDIPQPLSDFFAAQKARYAELFWYEQHGDKIAVMIEKLAAQAREILKKENAGTVKIVSFETDDSIGSFYIVDTEYIDVETRPSKEEYRSIMDKDLHAAFTDQTNDLYQGQLVRGYKPEGYDSWCVVAYHSFGLEAPRGPIGWIKSLDGLRKTTGVHFGALKQRVAFADACKAYEGVRYTIGGGSVTHGFDCSSLVQRVFYDTKGVWLPRKAKWQALVCAPLTQRELMPGDLVFFNRCDDVEKEIDHVAVVWQAKAGKLPIVFHAKRIRGKALFEDLNESEWLADSGNPQGQWEINSLGRVKL